MCQWLHDCCGQRSQERSKAADERSTTSPKRLIKIGSRTESLRLITPNQGTAYKYALLSYCWVGDQAGKTLRCTLPLYQTSISTHRLSASIRDAIAVTRILGLEYLWVDSLCMSISLSLYQSHTDRSFTLGIVQDDAEELTVEISKQARIYQNGAVTILAGGARSAKDGFLHKRQIIRHRCHIKIRLPGSDLPETVIWFDIRKYGEGNARDPIDRRAWIFQEGKLPYMTFKSTSLTYQSCYPHAYCTSVPFNLCSTVKTVCMWMAGHQNICSVTEGLRTILPSASLTRNTSHT
jgi:hypothetical protein